MILINMEMPPNCSECAFCGYYGYGAHMCDIIEKAVEYESAKTSRHDDCPLIHIQAHGRLIDADELLSHDLGGEPYHSVIRRVLMQAPTTLPADKDGADMTDRFGYGEIGLDINPRHPCEGCRDYEAPDGCKSNGGCGRPQNNGDKIRAMSDEELAKYMGPYDSGCPRWNGKEPIPCEKRANCRDCWLDWLKAPAEEG